MPINVNNNFAVTAPKAIDDRSGKFSGGQWIPFVSKVEAFAATTASRRSIGVSVMIGAFTIPTDYAEYEFKRASTYPTGGDSGDGWDLVLVTIPANLIVQDSTHRFVTDTEKIAWNADAGAENYTELDDAATVNLPVVNSPLNSALGFKVNKSSFVTGTGTSWDIAAQPRRKQTISANTAFTLSGGIDDESAAIFVITTTGAFTASFDSIDYPIRENGRTAITVMLIDGTYFISSEYNPFSPTAFSLFEDFETTAVGNTPMELSSANGGIAVGTGVSANGFMSGAQEWECPDVAGAGIAISTIIASDSVAPLNSVVSVDIRKPGAFNGWHTSGPIQRANSGIASAVTDHYYVNLSGDAGGFTGVRLGIMVASAPTFAVTVPMTYGVDIVSTETYRVTYILDATHQHTVRVMRLSDGYHVNSSGVWAIGVHNCIVHTEVSPQFPLPGYAGAWVVQDFNSLDPVYLDNLDIN